MYDLTQADDYELIAIAGLASFLCGPLAPVGFFVILIGLYIERRNQRKRKKEREEKFPWTKGRL